MNSGWSRFLRLNFGFLLISFKKLFFPEFDLLNSGCGLSVGAAYLRVFTVIVTVVKFFPLVFIDIRFAKTKLQHFLNCTSKIIPSKAIA